MLLNNRLIFNDNGTLSDLSHTLNNIRSGTQVLPIVAAEDFFYVGSDLPFNNRYFETSVANATASTLTVQLWDGSAWSEAVDVLDDTSLSGASLGQSGLVSWSLDKAKTWAQEDTENITGLTTLKIYNLYWARFKWSADLDGTSALKFVGFKFSDDDSLAIEYPELVLANTLANFETGKTTWDEQHVAAARQVIRDLKKNVTLISGNQIIRPEQFEAAAMHYVAYIAFNAFGDDWQNNAENALKQYSANLHFDVFNIDRNKNTRLDSNETFPSKRVIRR